MRPHPSRMEEVLGRQPAASGKGALAARLATDESFALVSSQQPKETV